VLHVAHSNTSNTNPELLVKSTLTGNANAHTRAQIESGGGDASLTLYDKSNYWTMAIDQSNSSRLDIGTGQWPTPKLSILTDGNVGIGTTGPAYLIDAVETRDEWVFRITNSNANPHGQTIRFTGAAPDDASQMFLYCYDTAANRTKITSDGDVWTSDSGILTSDERLKTNIVDTTSKLADVMRLRVRNFEWIPEYHPAKVGEKKIGFIAQELEEVFPKLIIESDIAPDNSVEEQLYTADDDLPDGKNIGDVKIAAKAHEPKIRKSYKDAFAPILVKALQEVTTRLEAAEAKIAALEAA
jgi:hypothetical protein